MSGYEDERKSSSKSPIEESQRDGRLSSLNRPQTAKRNDQEIQKIPKKTIFRFNPISKPKKNIKKERNSPLVSKLKPQNVSMEKERLYIENISLKVTNNELKDLITKYKAKTAQLEKEIQKKNDGIVLSNSNCNTYLVKILKQNIKDLRAEIQNKDMELHKYRQNMKLSKYLELELEVKAYMDECTRLRHYLEEVLRDKDESKTSSIRNTEQVDFKTINLLKIIEENTKEIQKLKEKIKTDTSSKTLKTPKFQEEIVKVVKELETLKKEGSAKEKKLLADIEKLKKQVIENESQISVEKLKQNELNSLVENLYEELKSLRHKKKSKIAPPRCLVVLNNILESEKIEISEYIKKLSRSNESYIETKDFLENLKLSDSTISDNDLDIIITYAKYDNNSKISVKRLIDYFNTYDFTLQTKSLSTSSDLFQHLSLRMQLHRIAKENLMETLVGAGFSSSKKIHSQEIVLILTNVPFNFSRKQAAAIVEEVFGKEKTKPYSEFIQKFNSLMPDWEILTSSDEETFDNYLLSLVSKYKLQIEAYCSSKDSEDTGIVSLKEFYKCLETHKITISDRLSSYLLVLFYSHNMELNSVPYKQFLQAYSNGEESPKEDYKTILIQKYLELISNKLISSQQTTRSVFLHDESGFIVGEDFVKGLKTLEIDEIPKENLLILLEALQYDPEERIVVIHIEEFEEILESYGVPKESNADISEIISDSDTFAEINGGHIQKISLLDSAQISLSETPEPGPRTSRVSFGDY
jgi:hypothetical protein